MTRMHRKALIHTILLAALAGFAGGCSTFALFVPSAASGSSAAVVEYIHREDLDRDGISAEDLDVVFLIHPRCHWSDEKAGGESEMARVFHHVAANVLSETFRSAIEVHSEEDLKEIESYRDLVFESGKRPLWLLDPALLLVVDYRPPFAAGEHGQLQLRVLDLKLARLAGSGYELLERDLHNRRALVCEGYQEVGPFTASRSGVPETAALLGDAWKALLRELLGKGRYPLYRAAIRGLAAAPERAAEQVDEMRLLFLGHVPDRFRPFNEKDGIAGFEDRVRIVEDRLLFGRDEGSATADPVDEGPDPQQPASGAVTASVPVALYFPIECVRELPLAGGEGEPTGGAAGLGEQSRDGGLEDDAGEEGVDAASDEDAL